MYNNFYLIVHVCNATVPNLTLFSLFLSVWLSCDRASFMYTFKYNQQDETLYEGWNFNSGNYLFTTDTK